MLDVHKGTSRSPPPVSRRLPLAKETIGIEEVGKRWRFGFSSGVSPSILLGGVLECSWVWICAGVVGTGVGTPSVSESVPRFYFRFQRAKVEKIGVTRGLVD
ncbi:hypothetical protein B296_00021148 [Ensete ventricosum]|uniref:Uncharacterized protein n=1 Tax=Ensete ventricosum TaxID=4639 RepID=A0A427ANV1_ENSVE|nr:hypothetical protein B296_00021148 [Ensete ventricosum]